MISKDEVKKLAGLARIGLSEEEVASLQGDMERILGYVSEIQKAKVPKDLAQIIPAHHNVFRADNEPHQSGIYTESLLAQAPKRKGNYLQVKKIIED